MKRYRFINLKQSIASYMVGFQTNRMTHSELNDWSQYLEKVLTTDDYQAIVFHGKRYLDELQKEDDSFLFNIGDNSIKLADGKTKHDLDEHVLSYVDANVLLAMLEAPDCYKRLKENEEHTFV